MLRTFYLSPPHLSGMFPNAQTLPDLTSPQRDSRLPPPNRGRRQTNEFTFSRSQTCLNHSCCRVNRVVACCRRRQKLVVTASTNFVVGDAAHGVVADNNLLAVAAASYNSICAAARTNQTSLTSAEGTSTRSPESMIQWRQM
jgi:hypothetical protein